MSPSALRRRLVHDWADLNRSKRRKLRPKNAGPVSLSYFRLLLLKMVHNKISTVIHSFLRGVSADFC